MVENDLPLGTCTVGGKEAYFYTVWRNMFRRVREHHSYIGCSVDQRWHKLSDFKLWFDANYIEGTYLDKDLYVEGNRVYSPDTCFFVPENLNHLFKSSYKTKGYNWDKERGKWAAKIKYRGKTKNLGRFADEQSAREAYTKARHEYIVEIIQESSSIIKQKLYITLCERYDIPVATQQ